MVPNRYIYRVIFTANRDPFIQARAIATRSAIPGAIFRVAAQSEEGLQGTFEQPNGLLDLTTQIYVRYSPHPKPRISLISFLQTTSDNIYPSAPNPYTSPQQTSNSPPSSHLPSYDCGSIKFASISPRLNTYSHTFASQPPASASPSSRPRRHRSHRHRLAPPQQTPTQKPHTRLPTRQHRRHRLAHLPLGLRRPADAV